MLYRVQVIENLFIDISINAFYLDGTKICSKKEDYSLFKESLIVFSQYLRHNKNTKQKISFTFCVEFQVKTSRYDSYNNENHNVNISIRIVQKDSIKSLLIEVNEQSHIIEIVDLDVFLNQLRQCEDKRSHESPFELITSYCGVDEQILESIGELYIPSNLTLNRLSHV